MSIKNIPHCVWRRQIEDSLRQEFEQNLLNRIDRHLQIQTPKILPYHKDVQHFIAPSAECYLLFRDGYFYGCVAPIESVAEALVRFVWERNHCGTDGDFEKRVKVLSRRKFISDKLKRSLLEIWNDRHDYHHLSVNIKKNFQELEQLAKRKLQLVSEVDLTTMFAMGYWFPNDKSIGIHSRDGKGNLKIKKI